MCKNLKELIKEAKTLYWVLELKQHHKKTLIIFEY